MGTIGPGYSHHLMAINGEGKQLDTRSSEALAAPKTESEENQPGGKKVIFKAGQPCGGRISKFLTQRRGGAKKTL